MSSRLIQSLAVIAGTLTSFAAVADKPADWQLGPNGLGPIKIGMTVEEANKASGINFRDTGLYDYESCKTFAAESLGQISLIVQDGKIATVSVYDDDTVTMPSIKTSKGIGLGDAPSAIQAAYGAPSKTDNPYDSERLFYQEAGGLGIRFNIGEAGISQIEVGTDSIENMEGCS
jgi:hypothetical protein